ncbi:hypothetical protein B9Z55_000590 [Caenorhabditis nigoni]|nr:hypothetical protein B9Z55_000590 [Caenorhabditis nigoni]
MVDSDGERMKNFHKRKFEKIGKKLESIEESIAKIPKFDDDVKNVKSERKFVLKHDCGDMFFFNKGDSMKSEKRKHFNAKWYMKIRRCESFLTLYLFCRPTVPVGEKWSIETNIGFKLIGSNNETIAATKKKFCFDETAGVGFEYFEWEYIKKYVEDNSLDVEAEIEILKMTGFGNEKLLHFDESQKDYSDVVLVVKDTKFYVLRKYLASQSSYFKALLLGNFSESKLFEVELKEVDPEEFQLYLETLYGESAIDDKTVENVARLADMYDSPKAIRKCEEFLLEKSEKTLKEKLKLATRYNLRKLKEKCMDQIESIEDVQAVIPDSIDDLDHQTTLDLLAKMNSLL